MNMIFAMLIAMLSTSILNCSNTNNNANPNVDIYQQHRDRMNGKLNRALTMQALRSLQNQLERQQ